MHKDFETSGFLSCEIADAVPNIRGENVEWFDLVEDTNTVLMRIVAVTMEDRSARGINWSREAVAVRILMRSCVSLQGIVILAERGMVTQARMLVRSIIEDSFCSAGLIDTPNDVINMLREDSEASRRNQAKFIVAQQLGNSEESLKKLDQALSEMDKKASLLSPKRVAHLSSMLPQYLNYLRLSDDSVHTSASSLHKHLVTHADGKGWSYKWGPAQQAEVEATLHRAVLAAMPVGIVANQIVPDPVNSAALVSLGERFQALPSGAMI